MFWDNADLTKKRGARLKALPPIPDTGWIRPENPPNLSSAVRIAFDCETKDTKLHIEGPGWSRGKAHIVGVSIGAEDRDGNTGKWYFPIRHEVEPHDNLNPAHVLPWLDSVLNTPHITKVGANLTYDIGNLNAEGVRVAGALDDVQFAEPLLDSEAFVSLDILASKYLGVGKTTDLLKAWCREAYPHTPISRWRADIYRTPPRLAAAYAEDDALLPLLVADKQRPLLEQEQLIPVYRMECDLIYLMIAMRFAGITVDVARAEQMIDELQSSVNLLYKQIYHDYGYRIDSSDSRQIGALFDHVGIPYGETATGLPKIEKEYLAGLEHPLGKLTNDIREHEKIIGTFLKGYILDKNVNGKLHPSFHQLKGDENGTIVGRFSSSDPNLQNIPARTALGKKVRTCMVPDAGHVKWHKKDQSQIHYRILAHYAVGPGSDELRAEYCNDPSTDYHWKVYHNVAPLLNWDTSDDEVNEFRRRPIKNVNFGLLYGQSEKALKYKTASYFGEGFSDADAEAFFKAYFEGAPYVKPTMKAIGNEVQYFGYVTSIMGRRIRFNLWEPAGFGERGFPLPYEAALKEYGPKIRRAFEYRGVNYKFQGSEPDVIKKGLLDCWNSGVFAETGVPRVTVHDENNWSLPRYDVRMKEALDYIAHLMTNCIKLRVPLKVDGETGPSWGEVKKDK